MKLPLRRAALCAALVAGLISSPTAAPSPNLVISQVYGGGGNTGAPYTHDFIEIFNRGTSPISLGGLSLQYASATGTGNFGSSNSQLTELPNVTLQPGQYYLVQEGGGTNGTPLAADLVDSTAIAMAAGAGKVALVNQATTLGCNGGSTPCSAAQLAQILDLVGYGGANFYETAAAGALSNTTAAIRKDAGCTDTDNNSADFEVGAPTPRNSTAPFNACAGAWLLSVGDASVTEGDAGATTVTFTVTLSSPARFGGVSFTIETADGTADAGTDYTARTAVAGHIAEGATTYTFDVEVLGDTVVEDNETFFVRLSDITGAEVGDAEGIGTIANDDVPPPMAIHAVQGAGDATPFAGQIVTTTGVVYALKNNGFFMQTPDGSHDTDPLTSEGLFVFTSTAPAVTAGQVVAVRGRVVEFNGLTEIATSSADPVVVTVLSSGNALPEPVVLTPEILDPAGPQLERFEGMRMHAAALISVSPTLGFGETRTVLQGMERPMREPGIPVSMPVPPDPTSNVVEPGIPRWDENPEVLLLDSDGLAGMTAVTVTSNVVFENVTGPLDYSFGAFKLAPEAALVRSADMNAVPVPAAVPGELTVAGFNLENFTGNGTSGARQRRKAALAIRDVLRYPDVIGHVEIASLAALQGLASEVSLLAAAAGHSDPAYQAHLIPFGTGTQHVGFLVKSSRVNVVSVTQELTDVLDPTETTRPLHDRPPLVLRATFGPDERPVIVVVNHLRSFIDVELVGGDGPRVRAKRTAQAESLAGLLQDLQVANPGTAVISIGDYNAYEFNDGYTDPIAILKGQPTPDEQIVVDGSPDLVNPDFINLTDALPRAERYTFMFEGTPQALDHMLVNGAAHARLTRYTIARNNADYPESPFALFVGNINRPEGNSDHDMPVAYFDLSGPSIADLAVTPESLGPPNHKLIDVAVSYVVSADSIGCVLSVASNEPSNSLDDGNTPFDWNVLDANRVQLRAERSGTGTGRIYTVTVTCTDARGNSSSRSATVTVPK